MLAPMKPVTELTLDELSREDKAAFWAAVQGRQAAHRADLRREAVLEELTKRQKPTVMLNGVEARAL